MSNTAPMGHNFPPSEIEILRDRIAEQEHDIRSGLQSIEKKPVPDVITDDKQAGELTDRLKNLRNVKKAVEGAHKSIKAPYFECGKVADAWKNAFTAEIEAKEKAVAKPLNAFLLAKEAEERARQLEIARIEREKAEALAAAAVKHEGAGINDVAAELLDAAQQSEALADRVDMNVMHARPADLAKARTGYASASRKMQWVGHIDSLPGLDLEKLRPYIKDEALQVALNAFVRNGGRECAGATIREEATGLNIR